MASHYVEVIAMVTFILIAAAVLVVGGLVLGMTLMGGRKAPAHSAAGAPAGELRGGARTTGGDD